MSEQANAIELSMTQMDEIQQAAASLAHGAAKSFGDVYKYALVSQRIMNTLTPDVINNVFLPLRNKDFGWREDTPGKYKMEELRDVFTSATLYGAIPANNEILIISGRFYPQKNFFTRKLAEMAPALTDLILKPGKVQVAPNGGALVNYSATWIWNGKAMEMVRTGDSAIPVRLNNGQGADAALGKAERKIKAAIYNRLTGSTFSEGEAEEVAIEGVPTASGVVVSDVTETPAAPAAPTSVVSQTKAVAEAVTSQRAEKAVPTGPQPWEGAGATATPDPIKAAAVNAAVASTPAAQKQPTAAQASQPVQQRQPAPPGQPGPVTPVAATQTQPAATTTKTTRIAPAPKFDGSGTAEVEEVTLKVTDIKGPKPPHRIELEDGNTYWTKDTAKASEAKKLKDQGVPVFVEYVIEPPGFRVVVDLKAADFGNGEGGDHGAEDQSDFEGGGERVVE